MDFDRLKETLVILRHSYSLIEGMLPELENDDREVAEKFLKFARLCDTLLCEQTSDLELMGLPTIDIRAPTVDAEWSHDTKQKP